MEKISQKLLLGAVIKGPVQQAYTTPGTYTWICPPGVTSVSVVCIGGGAGGDNGLGNTGGGGGELRYKNNISVTPGSSYTVVVGSGGNGTSQDYAPLYGTAGNPSYFINSSVCYANGGGRPTGGSGGVGDGGGNGGNSTNGGNNSVGRGGGGAGGYSGSGGDGSSSGNGASGSGGGGGGGAIGNNSLGIYAGWGGGVGIFGQGSSGGGGTAGVFGETSGFTGSTSPAIRSPGYGGGGSMGWYDFLGRPGLAGGGGAVRIIWPGNTRSFPSTNTQDL